MSPMSYHLARRRALATSRAMSVERPVSLRARRRALSATSLARISDRVCHNMSSSRRSVQQARDSYWHTFSFLGFQYLYDVESGALHRTDQVFSEVAGAFGVYSLRDIEGLLRDRYLPDQITSAYRDIEAMLETGMLTPLRETLTLGCESSGESAEADTCNAVSGRLAYRPLKAICLHVSHACNLRCSYCFVSKVWDEPAGRPEDKVPLMPPEVGMRAVDLMILESGRVTNLEVDFFGGEPLLNFDAVVAITDYARSAAKAADKSVHFSLTTNAVELTPEIVQYMDRMGFSVILSLDGRPETHNRWRRFPDGSGSYDRVLEGITTYLKHSTLKDYYVRGTYTSANLDFAEDVRYINQLGVDRISMEPVVSAGAGDYGLRLEDVPELRRQYERLVEYYSGQNRCGHPFEFFHFNLGALSGQCQERRLLGCGAGHQYLAVTPAGELYPCHQFVGDASFALGDVWSGVTRPDVSERFRHTSVLDKPSCRSCWARYLCSGGCQAVSYRTSGDIAGVDDVACEVTRTRLEAALAAYAMTASDE